MAFVLNHFVRLLPVLAFLLMILWAVITATKTLQRIVTSIELLVEQTEERGMHGKIHGGCPESKRARLFVQS